MLAWGELGAPRRLGKMVASFKVLPEEKSIWTREGNSCKRKCKWHLHLGLFVVFCRVMQVLDLGRDSTSLL